MLSIKKKRNVKKITVLYLMVLPALVLLFIFSYLPYSGLVIAFKDFQPFKGIWGSPWAGLKYFVKFLTDDKFYSVLLNTLMINSCDIIFGFTAPIIFALLANEIYSTKFKKIVQTISYLPNFLSWIVVSGVFYEVLSPGETGLVNIVLHNVFGIEPVYFMASQKLFVPIIVFADIWKNMGWSAILYFATIAGIDESLYEAADMDGAGRFKQAIYITIPSMVSIIVLMFLLKVSTIFTIGFDRIFLMQNPLVYGVSDVISTYVYRAGLVEMQFSLTTAIGFVQGILGFALIYVSNKLSKRIVGLGLY